MPWLDEGGQPVTDPALLQSLGAPPAAPLAAAPAAGSPAGGTWKDAAGNPVTDPAILKSLAPKPFGILPLSEDAQGGVHFDINAGLPGTLLRAFTAPGDVYAGRLDPMSPEANQRALDLATTFTPMNPAMRAGARAIPGDLRSARQDTPKAPTADELRAAASQGYDAARDSGAEYPGQAVAAAAEDTQRGLHSEGILAELAPQTHAILKGLQNPPEGSVVTIASLDAARKALNRIGGNFQNPTEQEASRRVIRRIDELIDSTGNGAGGAAAGTGPDLSGAAPAAGQGTPNGAGLGGVAENPQAQAASLLKDARGNAAAAFRSDRITGAEDAADLRASAANSGQNGGNTLRQKLASILLSDKQSRGFAPDELAAMRQVVEGTATSNTLRRVSNLLGGGGGLGQTTIAALGGAAGAALGGPGGAGLGAVAAPLAGAATRSGYNALVSKQVNAIDELLRQRSPLYQQRQADASLLANGPDQVVGLALRSLLMGPPANGLLGDR